MASIAGESAAIGGSHPSESGMGAEGSSAAGGGKAVPDDGVLIGGTGTRGD